MIICRVHVSSYFIWLTWHSEIFHVCWHDNLLRWHDWNVCSKVTMPGQTIPVRVAMTQAATPDVWHKTWAARVARLKGSSLVAMHKQFDVPLCLLMLVMRSALPFAVQRSQPVCFFFAILVKLNFGIHTKNSNWQKICLRKKQKLQIAGKSHFGRFQIQKFQERVRRTSCTNAASLGEIALFIRVHY